MIPFEKSVLLRWQQEKWNVVCRAAMARRAAKNFLSSKYRDIIEALPDNPADTDGYHSKCYKNFTAVSYKNITSSETKTLEIETLPSQSTTTVYLEENVSPSEVNTIEKEALPGQSTTADIFSNKCLFCDKTIKTRVDGTKEYLGMIKK